MRVLNVFNQNQIDSLRIQSRPVKWIRNNQRLFEFEIDFHGRTDDTNVKAALSEVSTFANNIQELEAITVPWFPQNIHDFDHIGKKVLKEGDGIEEIDHPSFRDKEYVARRWEIARTSLRYKISDPEIPRIDYNENENGVWRYCFPKIRDLLR